jgi:hypothetical protein
MRTVTAVRLMIVGVLATLVLVACSGTGGRAAAGVSVAGEQRGLCGSPVTGTVEYSNGSVPAPHHFEWTLTVNGPSGMFALTPGYGSGGTIWKRSFTVAQGSDVALCLAIAAIRSDGGALPLAGRRRRRHRGRRSLCAQGGLDPGADRVRPMGGCPPLIVSAAGSARPSARPG